MKKAFSINELDMYYMETVTAICNRIRTDLKNMIRLYRGYKISIREAVEKEVGHNCLFKDQLVVSVEKQLKESNEFELHLEEDGETSVCLFGFDFVWLTRRVHSNILTRELKALGIKVRRMTLDEEKLCVEELRHIELKKKHEGENYTLYNIYDYDGDEADNIEEIFEEYNLNKSIVRAVVKVDHLNNDMEVLIRGDAED